MLVMKRKMVSAITLTILLTSLLTLAFNTQPVKASGTIYIRADGSIDPQTAPITTVDNATYTLTGNITSSGNGIIVERDNIIVDGDGYTVQGSEAYYSKGIDLTGRSNVTIKNTRIMAYEAGICLAFSSGNSVSGNNITANSWAGISLGSSSNNNSVSGNNLADNYYGIELYSSSNNSISGNTIANNGYGIRLYYSSNYNSISGNTIANNGYGIRLDYSSNNVIYHNNFIDNTQQVYVYTSGYANFWDNGYPSGGNYWSDHAGVDVKSGPNQDQPGSDGICDMPYIIDADNIDHYPLMNPYGTPPPPTYSLTITATVGGTTNPTPGTYSYTVNSAVEVSATPNANYLFHHWELDSIDVGSANPYSVLMDKNHALKAVFSPISPPKPPVGGYSVTIEGYTPTQSLTPYLALAAILTTMFTAIKRKMARKTKDKNKSLMP
jgi:parallel beta-helix repeat protein